MFVGMCDGANAEQILIDTLHRNTIAITQYVNCAMLCFDIIVHIL